MPRRAGTRTQNRDPPPETPRTTARGQFQTPPETASVETPEPNLEFNGSLMKVAQLLESRITKYSGEGSLSCRDWLNSVSEVLTRFGVSEDLGLAVLPGFLDGSAKMRYQALETTKKFPKTWKEAAEVLIKTMANPLLGDDAREELRELKQGSSSIGEYAQKLKRLTAAAYESMKPKELDSLRCDSFLWGLNPSIKKTLRRMPKPKSFLDLVNSAERESSILRQERNEEAHTLELINSIHLDEKIQYLEREIAELRKMNSEHHFQSPGQGSSRGNSNGYWNGRKKRNQGRGSFNNNNNSNRDSGYSSNNQRGGRGSGARGRGGVPISYFATIFTLLSLVGTALAGEPWYICPTESYGQPYEIPNKITCNEKATVIPEVHVYSPLNSALQLEGVVCSKEVSIHSMRSSFFSKVVFYGGRYDTKFESISESDCRTLKATRTLNKFSLPPSEDLKLISNTVASGNDSIPFWGKFNLTLETISVEKILISSDDGETMTSPSVDLTGCSLMKGQCVNSHSTVVWNEVYVAPRCAYQKKTFHNVLVTSQHVFIPEIENMLTFRADQNFAQKKQQLELCEIENPHMTTNGIILSFPGIPVIDEFLVFGHRLKRETGINVDELGREHRYELVPMITESLISRMFGQDAIPQVLTNDTRVLREMNHWNVTNNMVKNRFKFYDGSPQKLILETIRYAEYRYHQLRLLEATERTRPLTRGEKGLAQALSMEWSYVFDVYLNKEFGNVRVNWQGEDKLNVPNFPQPLGTFPPVRVAYQMSYSQVEASTPSAKSVVQTKPIQTTTVKPTVKATTTVKPTVQTQSKPKVTLQTLATQITTTTPEPMHESFSSTHEFNLISFKSICESERNRIENMRALLPLSVTSAFQFWLRRDNIQANWAGEIVLVVDCMIVKPDKIYWDHVFNETCYEKTPVSVSNRTLFIKQGTRELVANSQTRKFSICSQAKVRPVYTESGAWRTAEGFVDVRYPSFSDNRESRFTKHIWQDAKLQWKKVENEVNVASRKAIDGINSVKPFLEEKAVEFGASIKNTAMETVLTIVFCLPFFVALIILVIVVWMCKNSIFLLLVKLCLCGYKNWREARPKRRRQDSEEVNHVEEEEPSVPMTAREYLRRLEEAYNIDDVCSVVCSVRGSMAQLPHIMVKVNGKPFKALVDTGSTVTYMKRSSLQALGSDIKLSQNSSVTARAANGSLFSFLGVAELAIRIGSVRIIHQVKVSEDKSCPAEVLLGSDFLKKLFQLGHAVTFDLGTMYISDEKLELVNNITTCSSTRVRLAQNEIIPKRSELTVEARIEEVSDHIDYLVEDSHRVDEQIYVVGRALVRPDEEGKCFIPILNTSNTDVKLYKNSNIGSAIPLPQTEIPVSEEANIEKTLPRYTSNETDFDLNSKIDLSKASLSEADRDLLRKVISHHSEAFVGADGKLGVYSGPVRHRIDIIDNATIPAARVYRQSPQKRAEIEKQITDMKDKGIIRESESPYSAPIVLVPKPEKGVYRFTVDYRQLNSITRSPQSILPRIEDILDSCARKQIFSTLDFSQGFHQIPMEETHCERTAFSCHLGSYEYMMMPMGLKNSPRTFQLAMDKFKKSLRASIFCYLDDIIVPSDDVKTHIKDIDEVLLNIRKINMKLKPEKCRFALSEIPFLGFILSKDGIRPNPQKVSAINNFPTPKNPTDIKSFLGAASFFRKFIQNFSQIASPMLMLTKKDTEFVWGTAQQNAFEILKEKLMTAPILAPPKLGESFTIETDASGKGIGGVLKQLQDGTEKVICYFSRSLNKHEANYPPVELEALGIVAAVKRFLPYIDGSRTVIITDHAPLKSLLFRKEVEGRLVRYQLALQGLDIVIQYRPGKQNVVADALSRYPEKVNYLSFLGELKDRITVSQKQLSADQNADPHVVEMKTLCDEDPERGLERELFLKKGILYRIPPGINRNPIIVLGKSSKLIPKIITEMHESKFGSSHLGIQKTLSLIRTLFQWEGMENSVKKVIRSCKHCLMVKSPNRFSIEPLQKLEEARHPLDRVHADVIGPLPQTVSGNRYILTIVDAFTKFVVAEPMPDQTSSTLIKVLIDRMFSVHGAPTILVTDNGSNFLSKQFKTFLKAYGVQQNNSTPYHHAANGQVERMNRTVEVMLTESLPERHDDWDDILQLVVQSYNSTKHAATSYSPFYLMFGREPRTTFHLAAHQPISAYRDPDDYVENVLQHLSKIWTNASHCTDRERERVTHHYNTRFQAKRSEYKVGEKVLIRLNRMNKVSPIYSKPHTIVSIDYPNLFLTDGAGKSKKLHINQVRKAEP